MQKMTLVAGLVVLAAACGGEKKAEEQAPAAAPAAAASAAPATTGTTYDVSMEFDGKVYHYIPSELKIKSGDVINFHNKSGGPHNVSFWADSIPAGAAAVLGANMPNQMQPLSGSMIVEQDAVYTISFAGAPEGEYKFYCLPHLAMGMRGKIIIDD
ncbi:MAG TPA: plastocyanin/azurin family copper-binding protein [Gemmatimonadales bacterium]|nr:plastocyanin/azurin family copper-binding protein [Gemmatimonadales bacterium]